MASSDVPLSGLKGPVVMTNLARYRVPVCPKWGDSVVVGAVFSSELVQPEPGCGAV